MNELTPDAAKALNQLASVIAGRDLAIATNDLSGDPLLRLRKMQDLTLDELGAAIEQGESKFVAQCQRKLQSLSSLSLLVGYALH